MVTRGLRIALGERQGGPRAANGRLQVAGEAGGGEFVRPLEVPPSGRRLPAQRGQLAGERMAHGRGSASEVSPLRLGQAALRLVPASESEQVLGGVDVHEVTE